MGRFARITSIGVLQTTASALQRFRGEASGALDDLDIELRRILDWIHHDRKEYWDHELRRSFEMVSQARIQLQQARISRQVAGHEPACIDEKRALERAKRRLEIAEQKVQAVRLWAHAIDRAIEEYQRSRAQFLTWLDTDMLQAVAALDRMSASLESYVSLETPVSPHAATPSTESPASDDSQPTSKESAPSEKIDSQGTPRETRT